jgi:two-component system OmpR family sensor kinase
MTRASPSSTTSTTVSSSQHASKRGSVAIRRQAKSGWLRAPLRSLTRSARARLIGWQLLLVFAALAASIFVARQYLLARMDDRIDREIRQEVGEFTTLANEGTDPLTGQSFGDVRRLMRFNLQRNIPDRNETMFSLVNDRPDSRISVEPPLRLDLEPDLVARFAQSTDPGLSDVETSLGTVRYSAVPVSVDGGSDRGVFVIAIFRDRERQEVDDVTLVLAGAGLLGLVLAAGAAWLVAGRVLAPVRLVRQTADSITHTDLSSRIEVAGTDEIAELADTFNRMLTRLEEAFSSQRQFLDDAGHELRTPLTIIRGQLELMGESQDDREATMMIVNDELRRMSRMVDDLLTLAKADQPGSLQWMSFDLGDLTDEVFTKAEGLGERRWEMPERGEGTCLGDRERITQAVLQLAQNAVQHTHDGDRIELGSSCTRTTYEVWVRDFGPGVRPEDRDRIFSRFTRGSKGRRHSDGAGLGLSIVASIAEAHEGTVTLDDTEIGACFRLAIPRVPKEGPRA